MASKSVFCYDLYTSYPSIAEASRQTGVSTASISACCKGEQRYAGGYRWAFISVSAPKGKSTHKVGMRKPVYCVELGKIYDCAAEASRKTGVSASGISACCRDVQKTAGGYRWKYI